ncbi:LLM class flavin-dependent oxidoreductase [Actinoplanes subglobosus]|uniref:LLM class flavin-dependent oxidoreductase n=1 Tax=Actinoplanes subglobosus TaxID=1547892 RepID=A0ABV8IYZ5_9ACTN
MTAYSVLVPFTPTRPEQILPFAATVCHSRADRLWQGQSLLVETHQGFVYAAGAGFRVPAGLGVTLTPLRHPYEAALQARSLALTTGQSVVAGYGPGARPFQAGLLGEPYRSPLAATRDYLTAVRALLDGETAGHQGGESALAPFPAPRVDVGVGVLRPRMAALAGEVADVAITWLTPAGYLRDTVLPAMSRGAATAGRPRPRLTAMVPLALTGPDRDPARLALASNAAHLRMPHYQDMLRRSGIDVTGAETDAKALVEGRAFLFGDVAEIVQQVHEYRDAGVDEVVLNLTGVAALHGLRAALTETRTVLDALTGN